ncbi:hypothetical protein [Bacillus sp. Au-Bac7]|uniref:hypothetical protein n=1 Tax=Bacillus sp. Au-Bac7 TaxID=2906458 RepID=UPI001E423112|nr:hypothetical protein [Bacillus sp. Au-Bac7]MCE4051945.1 hypothetical protein [Bacillus sp. Au-Bac7]
MIKVNSFESLELISNQKVKEYLTLRMDTYFRHLGGNVDKTNFDLRKVFGVIIFANKEDMVCWDEMNSTISFKEEGDVLNAEWMTRIFINGENYLNFCVVRCKGNVLDIYIKEEDIF